MQGYLMINDNCCVDFVEKDPKIDTYAFLKQQRKRYHRTRRLLFSNHMLAIVRYAQEKGFTLTNAKFDDESIPPIAWSLLFNLFKKEPRLLPVLKAYLKDHTLQAVNLVNNTASIYIQADAFVKLDNASDDVLNKIIEIANQWNE